MAALIDECGNNKNDPLAMFRNGISKYTISSYKGTMNDGTHSFSFYSEMASKIKKSFVKNFHAMFDKIMYVNFLSLIKDDVDHFKNRSKRPSFLIRPFLTILNLEVNRLSLHQPEYEMDRTDYPVDYNFLEIGYCGHPTYPHTSIQLEQDSDLILSYFQKRIPFSN